MKARFSSSSSSRRRLVVVVVAVVAVVAVLAIVVVAVVIVLVVVVVVVVVVVDDDVVPCCKATGPDSPQNLNEYVVVTWCTCSCPGAAGHSVQLLTISCAGRLLSIEDRRPFYAFLLSV